MLMVAYSDDEEEWRILEDGFGVILRPSKWEQFRSALQAGTSFECGEAGNDSHITLEWE